MGKPGKGGGSSSSSGSKDDMIDIDPECIRFTHARIRPFFTGCGRRIEDTLADIISAKISVNDLPKITVILNEGTYFSLNNRRLYVLKELRSRGLLKGNTIGARLKVALEREKDKYKVDRCSMSAKIMRESAAEDKELVDDGLGEEEGEEDNNDIRAEVKTDTVSRVKESPADMRKKSGPVEVKKNEPEQVIIAKRKKGTRRSKYSDDDS